jgi:hypothetical protein
VFLAAGHAQAQGQDQGGKKKHDNDWTARLRRFAASLINFCHHASALDQTSHLPTASSPPPHAHQPPLPLVASRNPSRRIRIGTRICILHHRPLVPHRITTNDAMAGGKGKSSGGKSSGGKTSADGNKKQQSHSARAGLQVSFRCSTASAACCSCFSPSRPGSPRLA